MTPASNKCTAREWRKTCGVTLHKISSGCNLIIIRDLLGHVSIQTTEVYARVSSKSKTKALEKAFSSIGIVEPEVKNWQQNNKLKEFLKGLV